MVYEVMSTTFCVTAARLADTRALADFLSAIPNGDRLGQLLHAGSALASRAYDDDRWIARFVASDGEVVKCFTVTDITIDQAEMIAAVGMDLMTIDAAGFRDLAVQALGPSLDADDFV